MPVDENYEWQLADGPLFGGDHPAGVIGVDYGTTDYEDQDERNPRGGGLRMGLDMIGAPRWVLSVATRAAGEAAGLDALESITGSWRSAARGLLPGQVVPLMFGRPGSSRFIFGRPRATSPEIPGRPTIDYGITFTDLAFQLADARIFDATERSLTLSLRTQSGGGWKFPTRFPIETAPSAAQSGQIEDVGGTTDTPVVVTINGPISNPWVTGPGWRIDLSTSLAFDQSVTIDARPWATSVIRNDGASLAGRLSRRVRLVDVSLPPGAAGLTFGGIDPTATSTAVVAWRPAFHSI